MYDLKQSKSAFWCSSESNNNAVSSLEHTACVGLSSGWTGTNGACASKSGAYMTHYECTVSGSVLVSEMGEAF